jgi:hypothetical protein
MAKAKPTWHNFAVVFRELGEFVDGRAAYEDDLQGELRRLGIGEVLGGGSSLDDDDEDGEACDIDIQVTDPVAGLRAIRVVLQDIGAPFSTRIIGDDGEFPVYESEEHYRECVRAIQEREQAEE